MRIQEVEGPFAGAVAPGRRRGWRRYLARLVIAVGVGGLAAACGANDGMRIGGPQSGPSTTPSAAGASTTAAPAPANTEPTAALEWKAVLVAGDDAQGVFDNGRRRLAEILRARGVRNENIRHLSVAVGGREPGVLPTTVGNLRAALKSLAPTKGSGCFVFMTSHGEAGRGIVFGRSALMPNGRSYLNPVRINAILDETCGDLPTIVIASSCYSGQFIDERSKRPNRIILTAAARTLPSFGCNDRFEFTFFDDCLLGEMIRARDWPDVYQRIRSCVTDKERQLNQPASQPQAYFGGSVRDLPLIGGALN